MALKKECKGFNGSEKEVLNKREKIIIIGISGEIQFSFFS